MAREPGQIRQGLRYVRGTPELLIPLLMIAVIGTLAWEFQVSLPLMASKVFGGGAAAYGLMASVMGAGAVAGGLVSARVDCAIGMLFVCAHDADYITSRGDPGLSGHRDSPG